ncbi:MAG: hypothetical protein AB7F96_09825 [Beijerinckiaceae bacterium]
MAKDACARELNAQLLQQWTPERYRGKGHLHAARFLPPRFLRERPRRLRKP